MKLSIDINQQSRLLDAHMAMDGYETVTPGVEQEPKVVRVPYKLGANRRIIVKNMTALKASLASYNETRRELFKECFPEWPEEKQIVEADNPQGFARFQAEDKTTRAQKDDIELLRLPETAVYNSDNEFPALALAVLDEHGLIEGLPAAV